MKQVFLVLAIVFLASLSHAQTCGPPDYASPCALGDTAIHPYPLPIPSWGPNTACMNAATSPAAIGLCGNLTGAGITITTNDDFHSIMTRCTDSNVATTTSDSTPYAHVWETADEPSVNLWNSDDTAILLLINSGQQWIFLWDGTACHLLKDVSGNGISFPAGTVWSRSLNNHIYGIDKTTAGGPYLRDNVITLTPGAGAVSTSTLFNFSGNTCLTNSVNGYTGGTFPLGRWTGALSSPDGITFGVAFSLLPGQGSGFYQVRWTVGQTGCDLWNTLTGTVTHNGTLLGTIPDAPWGGAFGGKADRFKIHNSDQGSAAYANVGITSSGGLPYGTYNAASYVWDGTTNAVPCGITAPNWVSSHPYLDGNRVIPLPVSSTGNNPGGYLFQIINGVSGNSGTDITIFKTLAAQTPGGNVTDGPLTWRNVGLGTSTTPYFVYNCDGHALKGSSYMVVGRNFILHSYANPNSPLISIGPVDALGNHVGSPGDEHVGNTNLKSDDTNWIFAASTDVGTAAAGATGVSNILQGPIPGALYMEQFFVGPINRSPGVLNCLYNAITCPNGTFGQIRRVAHAFGSGWHKAFDVQNLTAVVSQTGKYEAFTTDGFGQFGNTAGGAKCNVGGPDWSKASTLFSVGSLIYPDLGQSNNGFYIYKVQGCSGACMTGAVHPTWVQNSTVSGMGTFTDGTITWQGAPDVNTSTNTAVMNCRADIMVVKLFRGAGPAPATTAPVLTMFTKLKMRMRGLYEKNFHHNNAPATDGWIGGPSATLGTN